MLLTASCSTGYTLRGISRTRLVVDKRYDAQPDAAAVQFLAPYKAKVDSVMSPVLGVVATDMVAERPESNLSNLLADILVAMSADYGEKPDFGVYNIGGIRAALVKGEVTYGDVLDVAPFENKICFVTLSGESVLRLFGQMAMRGGECVSHGVELVIGSDGRLRSARLHGKDVDPQASYRVVTIDYVAQGNDQMTAFKEGTALNAPEEAKNNSREVIADYFRRMTEQGKVVTAEVEGRIRVSDE